ncbi:MAG: bifunctional phosphopantothenoylcysteine decarboxylase/phosphopantothenate--cysteine ligase CoaBC [Eubacterium sp.]|nr:bifunctional phosphopantothenoylcysteine decarboxylase/phosphopantothenate--cysteine ligase CoaBC [Eubacterium sp.]
MLNGKTIIIGVTGSIAAYKAADLVSMLKKDGADVHVIMTKNATEIIGPITFDTLSGNKCITDTFDREHEYSVEHVALAKKADAFMIAPATANVIGKLAAGIADDMLTTTALAFEKTILIAPAMNTAMYENKIVQANLEKLKEYGYEIIEPASGHLACGDDGKGKLPDVDILADYISRAVEFDRDMVGKKVLVTAGPTVEHFDPVRFITNHSTGKMGYELARVASGRGAEVTLISGPVNLAPPSGVELIKIESAADMFAAVKKHYKDKDIIIKAAAVADYTPAKVSGEKIKKTNEKNTVELVKTQDILAWLGEHKKQDQIVCGFAMETEDLIDNATKKLVDKNADMIVANNLKTPGAGFAGDTNVITLVSDEGTIVFPQMTKHEDAEIILNKIIQKGKAD